MLALPCGPPEFLHKLGHYRNVTFGGPFPDPASTPGPCRAATWVSARVSRQAAGRAAELRRIAAQRCVLRYASTAHAAGGAFLSRLLAACPRRGHFALGNRGGAGHRGRLVLGSSRDAAPARQSELAARRLKANFRLAIQSPAFQSRVRQGIVGVPAADNDAHRCSRHSGQATLRANSLRKLPDRNCCCARVRHQILSCCLKELLLCSERPIASQS